MRQAIEAPCSDYTPRQERPVVHPAAHVESEMMTDQAGACRDRPRLVEACPAQARRAGTGRITRRPRRTIGRERSECSIARTRVFVMWPVGRSRKRPRREAGLRYSAGRAQRGCGRFLSSVVRGGAVRPAGASGISTDSNEGLPGQQDGSPEAPVSNDQSWARAREPGQRMLE